MGITEALEVYKHAYGDSERVMTAVTQETKHEDQIDQVSIDIVDLLTLSIPCGRQLAHRMASWMASRPGQPMGQMVVFYNAISNVIYELFYDSKSVVTTFDLMQAAQPQDRWTGMYFRKNNATLETQGVLNAVCKRVSTLAKTDPPLTAALVPVNIPKDKRGLERIVDLVTNVNCSPSDREPPNTEWLKKLGINEGEFITFAHLHHNREDGAVASANVRFKCASLVQELEGLVLLYAWNVAQRVDNALVKHAQGRRCLIMVTDGPAPPIKELTRKRRALVKNKQIVNKTDTFFPLCEKLFLKLPKKLMLTALYDVIRIPLAVTTRSNTLYELHTNLVEAEDEMVKLTCMLTGVITPAALSDAYDLKTIHLLDAQALMSAKSREKTLVSDFFKKNISWSDLGKRLQSSFKAMDGVSPYINLYSSDSDVLGKWNLTIDHHRFLLCCDGLPITPLANGHVSPRGVFFYRNRIVSRNASTALVEEKADPIAISRWKASTMKAGQIRYNLLQSPLFFLSENTMLIMLTRGSDYNDPIVSLSNKSNMGVEIREEAALFFRTTCICEGGWGPFLRESHSLSTLEKIGLVCDTNVAKEPCPKCHKPVIMPFWATKAWYTAISSDVLTNNVHVRRAVGCAANVMAALTLGSFNKAVYGLVSSPIGYGGDQMFSSIREEFYAKNTRGGIPVSDAELKNERRRLFICANSSEEDEGTSKFELNEIVTPDSMTQFWENVLKSYTGEGKEIENIQIETAPTVTEIYPHQDLELDDNDSKNNEESLVFHEALSDKTQSRNGRNILTQLAQRVKRTEMNLGTLTAGEKCMDLLVLMYLNMCGYEDPTVIKWAKLRLPLLHVDAINTIEKKLDSSKKMTNLRVFHAAVAEVIGTTYHHAMDCHQAVRKDWPRIILYFQKLEENMRPLINKYNEYLDGVGGGPNWRINTPGGLPLLGISRNRPWTALAVWGLFSLWRTLS